jgi:beta-1,3-galactosyltransferase 1
VDRNLTLKAVAASRWTAVYCKRANYILKADDDVFVNVFTLMRYIYHLFASGSRSRLIHCRIWKHAPVVRVGKWAVSSNHRSAAFYPDYCAGLAYIQTGDVARALYRMSLRIRFFWIDDVYMTGDLVKALGGQVNLTDISTSYHSPLVAQQLLQDRTKWHRSVWEQL